MASFGKKVPTLQTDQTSGLISFASYGNWKTDLGAYFSRNETVSYTHLRAHET